MYNRWYLAYILSWISVAKETPVISSSEKARFCSKAMRQSMCTESLVKAIDILPQAPMLALKLDADLRGSNKVKKIIKVTEYT